MKRFFFLALVLICGGLAFSQNQGRTMYVMVKNAELRASAAFFANTLGALPLGSPVTVLQDRGKWLEVRLTNSRTGWVAAASLTSKRITGTGRSATAEEIALAGKGFSPAVEVEYRKSGLDYSAVDSMEILNIPKNELSKFIADGHLSRGE